MHLGFLWDSRNRGKVRHHCGALQQGWGRLGAVGGEIYESCRLEHVRFRSHFKERLDSAHVRASPKAVAPFNSIIGSSSDLAHPITTVKSNTQNVGSTVCFFGATSHHASPCGVIELISVSGTVRREDGKFLDLTDLVQMSKVTQGGDSGGPVYAGLAAFGVVTAGATNGRMIYSKAGRVSAELGITICTSSAC